MTIAKISGNMLKDNLERDANLAIETNLIYVDVVNNRVGINNSAPSAEFTVTGNINIDNGQIQISNTVINSQGINLVGTGDLTITANSGNVSVANVNIVNLLDPVSNSDAATKLYVDNAVSLVSANLSGVNGMIVPLGSPPTDGSLTSNVAYDGWSANTFVTDSIDDLNQVVFNIAKNTYVGAVDFSGNVLAGPSPLTVQFVGSYTGNPNSFYWDFGDGNISLAGYVVTHTYANAAGGVFDVSFKAFNTTGTFGGDESQGAKGSVDIELKNNYIVLYTPNPVPSFTLVDATIDSGTTATINNTSQYATSYQLDWGDSTTEIPDSSWSTLDHVYTNLGGDSTYLIQLDATSDTAGPSPVTVLGTPVTQYVFSTHLPTFTSNTNIVVNERATNGGQVSFNNTTATDPGSTAIFGSTNRYRWSWGDGNVETIDIQSGLAGNPGTAKIHTFTLTPTQQAAGIPVDFQVQLEVLNGHTTSPFTSTLTTVTVEPDVRANFTGTATTVSDATGDSAQTGYIFTDYNGNNRAEFTFNTTSQHADSYTWSWGDSTVDGPLVEGQPGTVTGGNLTHTYLSVGSKTVLLDIEGQTGTIPQTDRDTKTNYIIIKSNPAAPGNLSTKTLSMSTASQGTGPLLAAQATDNTLGNIPAAGTAVTRYATGSTLTTNTVTGVNTSLSGTLTCYINNIASGDASFDIATNSTGIYGNLVITDDRDAHLVISAATYPTGFYKVFNARTDINYANTAVGFNDVKLGHSSTGNTNSVGWVKDNLSAVPSVDVSSVTISQAAAGNIRYISGIPYYNTGGQITVSGIQLTNLIGQTYRNISPLTVSNGTLSEGTSGSLISAQSYTYSQVDGAVSMLVGGIPKANTGVTSAYTLGNITVNINGSARAVGSLAVNAQNINGSGSASNFTTKVQIYSLDILGFNELLIPVSDSLGSGFTDDGVRVSLGLSGDTPNFTVSDFYSFDQWSGAETIQGTDEAVVRWGTLQHFDDIDFSTGYLPAGPDLITGRSGPQYFTFAFRRSTVANFDIRLTGKISGLWIAAPGTQIDNTSTLNGWIDATTSYAGAGIPGSNTAAGGNGSNGCALTNADRIPTGTDISNQTYTMTLGAENLSNATGKNCLIRIKLVSGDSLTAISIGVAA